jgi:hypothetical protein
MKTKFKKDGITIKSIEAHNKRCDECYFGEEFKKGWWRCKDEIEDWCIPDCVGGYDFGKSRIYIEIK